MQNENENENWNIFKYAKQVSKWTKKEATEFIQNIVIYTTLSIMQHFVVGCKGSTDKAGQ